MKSRITDIDTDILEQWKNQIASTPQLMLKIDSIAKRLPITLVGILPGDLIITTAPRMISREDIFKQHIPVTVTHLFNGNVYGFNSEILHFMKDPARLIFIAFPENMERLELRKYERLCCHLPAKLLSGIHNIPGIIGDLSMGGCLFMAHTSPGDLHPEPQDRVQIDIEVLGEKTPFSISGAIKTIKLESNRLYAGISFDKKDERAGDIRRYVAEILETLNE